VVVVAVASVAAIVVVASAAGVVAMHPTKRATRMLLSPLFLVSTGRYMPAHPHSAGPAMPCRLPKRNELALSLGSQGLALE